MKKKIWLQSHAINKFNNITHTIDTNQSIISNLIEL